MISSIVIIGGRGGNPASLETQIEPVRLGKDATVAITSIAYGEILNVHDGNNKVYFTVSNIPNSDHNKPIGFVHVEPVVDYKVTIANGSYGNAHVLMTEVIRVINTKIKRKKDFLLIKGTQQNSMVNVAYQKVIIRVKGKDDSPWDLINIKDDLKESSQILNKNLSYVVPSLLYVNIVENSYINGKKSRNLGVIPLNSNGGYSFYEFQNPVYIPIEFHQFSSIVLELRDLDAEYIKFDPKWNTVISLHLKSINRE